MDIGLFLVVIGSATLVTGIISYLITLFYKKSDSYTSSTQFKETSEGKYKFFPFRLHNTSKIRGELSVEEGELVFALEDFFGYVPPSPFEWLSPSYSRWKGTGKHSFEVGLVPGDYQFMFITKANTVRMKLECKITEYRKPLERFAEMALVLVEVAVPILITGLVIYAGSLVAAGL